MKVIMFSMSLIVISVVAFQSPVLSIEIGKAEKAKQKQVQSVSVQSTSIKFNNNSWNPSQKLSGGKVVQTVKMGIDKGVKFVTIQELRLVEEDARIKAKDKYRTFVDDVLPAFWDVVGRLISEGMEIFTGDVEEMKGSQKGLEKKTISQWKNLWQDLWGKPEATVKKAFGDSEWKSWEEGKVFLAAIDEYNKKKEALAKVDAQIDKMLAQLYKQSAQKSQDVVAAEDFLIQLRRVSGGQPFKTEIDFIEIKVLADVLYDNVLHDYFDAVLNGNYKTAVIGPLTKFQEQLNYMSAAQVVTLAHYFNDAFKIVKNGYEARGMAMPYSFYELLFEPSVLVLDTVKFFVENDFVEYFGDMYKAAPFDDESVPTILDKQGVWVVDMGKWALVKVNFCENEFTCPALIFFEEFLYQLGNPDFMKSGKNCGLIETLAAGKNACPKFLGGNKGSGGKKGGAAAPASAPGGEGDQVMKAIVCASYFASIADGTICTEPYASDVVEDNYLNPKNFIEGPICPLKFTGGVSDPRPAEPEEEQPERGIEESPLPAPETPEEKDLKPPSNDPPEDSSYNNEILQQAKELAQKILNSPGIQDVLDQITVALIGVTISDFLPSIEEQNVIDANLEGSAYGLYYTDSNNTYVDIDAIAKEGGNVVHHVASTLVHEAIHAAFDKAGYDNTEVEHLVIKLLSKLKMCSPIADTCAYKQCTAGQQEAFMVGFTECTPVMSAPSAAGGPPPTPTMGGTKDGNPLDELCFGDDGGSDGCTTAPMDCPEGQIPVKKKGGGCKCGTPGSDSGGSAAGIDPTMLPGYGVTDPSPEPFDNYVPKPSECKPDCKFCQPPKQCVAKKTGFGCVSTCEEDPGPTPFKNKDTLKQYNQKPVQQPMQQQKGNYKQNNAAGSEKMQTPQYKK